MATPTIPVRGAAESAESYLDRLVPVLRRHLGQGGADSGAAPTLYDAQGRVIMSSKGLYAYAPDGSLPISPDIVAIDTQHIVNAAIETAKLGDGAVTGAKILDATIGTAKIGDAAIVTAKIGDAAITTAKIDDLAVNRAKIANAAIGSAQIEAASINTAHIDFLDADVITAGTITTDKIQAGNITVTSVGYDPATLTVTAPPSWSDLVSVSTTTMSGSTVVLQFTAIGQILLSDIAQVAVGFELRIRRGSTTIWQTTTDVLRSISEDATISGALAITFAETPSAGSKTYTVQGRTSSEYATLPRISNRCLIVNEYKR